MGRALFSDRYGCRAANATVTVAPQAIDEDNKPPVVYHKWSLSNRFDPDADEFFATAEYEAFLDRGEVDLGEHPGSDTPESEPNNDTLSLTINEQLLAQIQQFASVSGGGEVVAIRANPTSEMPVPVPIVTETAAVVEATPSTPPPMAHLALSSPSPAPTVTPRLYMWNRTQSPGSPPTLRRTHAPANHMITPRRLLQNA
ncbi:hypothetical protein MIND_00358900 [Mycena indigotica]|uniref:Uncharacterized protein n=1 Tax=Mycena indigotica TaxID=2126181 RepID=A0A8H6T1D8_9AGAR|nr:uncharacterized protein MIND_00358900 [Mycena indigotica]KAF7309868.1 hypothetical protein MIND_00358900 [Mycena indigotica]